MNRLSFLLLSLLALLVGEEGLVDQTIGVIHLQGVVVIDHLTINYADMMVIMLAYVQNWVVMIKGPLTLLKILFRVSSLIVT